jgi:hypothetical protein
MTKWLPIAILGPLALTSGCSTVITPEAVRGSNVPRELVDRSLGQWGAAIELVNEFLDERTLEDVPWFRLAYGERGMLLIREEGVQRFDIACTPWGWLIVKSGFAAQERSWGFVVGPVEGDQPVFDNSFFYGGLGLRGSHGLGGLILHEAIHTVLKNGTTGFFSGLSYYLQAIWHGGGEEHPHEARAYAIEGKFRGWAGRRKFTQPQVDQVDIKR